MLTLGRKIYVGLLPHIFFLTLVSVSYAHVQLLNPVGGEIFIPGSQVSIEWQEVLSHGSHDWDLYFSSDGGSTWVAIQEDISEETYSYYWTVPSTYTSNGRIRIVQDNAEMDYDDSSDDFTIRSVTGLEVAPESALKLYPNPASEILMIENNLPGHEDYTCILYDLQGTLIRKASFNGAQEFHIEVNDLAEGLYVFKLFSHNGNKHERKILIMNP